MQIGKKLQNSNGYLTYNDLDLGDAFKIVDDHNIYMKMDWVEGKNSCEDVNAVCLETGETFLVDPIEDVIRLNVELELKEE